MKYILNSFSYLISLLSLSGLDKFAKIITFVLFKIFHLRRKIILKNLDIAFKNEKSIEEKNYIAEQCFYHFILTVLEFFYFRKGELGSRMRLVNASSFTEAVQKNQGVYAITLHMGNWEAMASKVSKELKPVHIVVKKIGSAGINDFVTKRRQQNGVNIIERKSTGDAVRSMRNLIKQGKILAVMLDQARPGEPLLPFFGRPAKTNTSFAAIWSRYKAPVFIGYSVRNSVGNFTLHFTDELNLQDSGDSQKDAIENSLRINQALESCIRQYPEQYFWLHNRWK